MPSLGLNTQLSFHDDLLRCWPTELNTQSGSNAHSYALAAGSDSRLVAQFSLGAEAAADDEVGFVYDIKHLEDGSNTGTAQGVQSVPECSVKLEFEISDASGIITGAEPEAQILTLNTDADSGILNFRLTDDAEAKVFLTGGSPATQTINVTGDVTGDDWTTGIHVLDVYYKASSGASDGVLKVWVDGNELTISNATHNNTSEIGLVYVHLRVRDATGVGETPSMDARKFMFRAGALASPDAPMAFAEDDATKKPLGLLQFGDRSDTEVMVGVQELPGRYGWSDIYAKLLYAEGDTWPGDGSATETDGVQLTQNGLWLNWFGLSGFNAAANVMVRVVLGDDSDFTNSWTSETYSVPLLKNNMTDDVLSYPIDAYPLYCQKHYGRGQGGALEMVAANLSADADNVVMILEDEVYSDDGEPDTTNSLAYPLDLNAAPDYGTQIPVGSGWGIMTRQMELWRSPGFSNLFGQTSNFRCGPADHIYTNSWDNLTWADNYVYDIDAASTAATSGTFTLTVTKTTEAAAQTTSAIDYDATAAEIETALEALSNVTEGDVACTQESGTDLGDNSARVRMTWAESVIMTINTSSIGGNAHTLEGNVNSAQFAYLTRGEINDRGDDFLAKAYQAGMLDPGFSGQIYRSKKIGPVEFVYLNVFNFASATSKLGAVQKSWLLALIQATTAKHLCILSGVPIFDLIYKSSQDWHSDADWQAERDEILAAIEANPNIESNIWLSGDAHAAWWYPNPSPSHPKCLGEFAGGAASSTILADTLLPEAQNEVSEIEALLAAHGGGGFIETQGQEFSDGTHTRMFGRLTYDTLGGLTIRVYNADVDHDDLADQNSDFSDKVLHTVNVTAFSMDGRRRGAGSARGGRGGRRRGRARR